MDKTDMEKVCKEITSEFDEDFLWKWDSRFETALAEIQVESQEYATTILTRHLANTWNDSNVLQAPEGLTRINPNLYNLQKGQQLFTTDLNQDTFVFCAWWPWGNGDTISIRIAPFYGKATESQKTELSQLLRAWFNI